MNHTALGIDFLRVECEGRCPVVKDEKACVLHACTGYGYVADVVYGLVNRGVGIEVVAEFDAVCLAPVDDSFAREIVGAVEAHVLQEVGEAALVFLFECRAYFLCDIEVGLTFGCLVMAYEVRQAVFKDSGDNSCIGR